jgi:hypothetical protein
LIAITGEIPRETSFEKGFPFQYTEDPTNEGNLIPDPLIRDDQALVVLSMEIREIQRQENGYGYKS